MKQKPKENGEWKEEKGMIYQWPIEQDADGGVLSLIQPYWLQVWDFRSQSHVIFP